MNTVRGGGAVLGAMLSMGSAGGLAAAMPFDSETLRLRGIDPQVAEYLSQAARFTAGSHPVALSVNGQPRGQVQARFDSLGALCFDQALRDAALIAGAGDGERCGAFVEQYPQTQVELQPQTGQVNLWVPLDALQPLPADLSAYTFGGVAGLLNYDVQGLYNQFEGGTSQFWSANTEAGFNAGDWIVRSRQLYTSSNGRGSTEHLEAYGQRTFAEQQAVFQLGQINLFNPVLAGARINGLQWMSEPALSSSGVGGRIEGIAASQARVELRQSGALVYSTVVPAGPFTLEGVSQLDTRRDVQVTVIEADDSRRTFTVPAATMGVNLPASGFAFGAGQVRDLGGLKRSPWVLSAGWSQPLFARTSVSSGVLAADGYNAAGAGLGLDGWTGSRLQGLLQAAQTGEDNVRGVQGSVTLQQQFNPFWSASLTASRQSSGYRELADTLLDNQLASESRYREQYAMGLSWSHPRLGSLNGGYSLSTLYNGRKAARAYTSWGQRVGKASLSLSAEWNVAGDAGLGNALYLSASLPLGERRRLRTSVRGAGGKSRVGVGLQEQVSDTFGYRLAGERNSQDKDLDITAGVSLLPRVAQVDLGYTSYGQGNAGYSGALRGGMAVHEGGLTLSPYALQDTFALLSVGELPGVRVDTPGGTVWTDGQGQAVVAQVAPYAKSSVQVVSSSLPRNVDILQGAAVLQAGRGAVPRLAFGVQTTRRLLLQAVTSTGQALPAGALVSDGAGALVTLVQADGTVFVPNAQAIDQLWVRVAGQAPCELHYELAAEADPDAYFETTQAVCRPSQGKQA